MRPLTLFMLVVGVACLVTANEEDAAAEETPVEPEDGHQTGGAANNTVVQPPEAEHEAEPEADPTPEPGAAPETAHKDDNNNGARLLTSSFLAALSAVALHAVLV